MRRKKHVSTYSSYSFTGSDPIIHSLGMILAGTNHPLKELAADSGVSLATLYIVRNTYLGRGKIRRYRMYYSTVAAILFHLNKGHILSEPRTAARPRLIAAR